MHRIDLCIAEPDCTLPNIDTTVQVCDPEMNSGQAATLRLNVAMKEELRNERGNERIIVVIGLAKKIRMLRQQ